MSKVSTGKKSKRLTASAGDSPALPSVALEKEKEATMTDGSGPNLSGAFARFDQDGSLLKMSEGCYLQTLEGNLLKFSGTFPASGTMRSGVLYPRQASEPPTEENESSSWPTPDASVSEGYNQSASKGAQKRPALAGKVKDWPTPRANESTGKCVHGQGGLDLQTEVALWNTLTTEDAKGRGYTYDKGDKDKPRMSLVGQAWATPTSRDHKDGANPSEKVPTNSLLGRHAPRTMQNGKASLNDGPTLRQPWPTPNAVTNHNRGSLQEYGGKGNAFRGTEMGSLRLNPSFVEWLMGFPIGWTALEPSETPSFRKSRKSSGE